MNRTGVRALAALLALCIAAPALAADFDARRPKDVLSVVTTNGASGVLKTGTDGKPFVEAKAAKVFFDVDFYDCDDAKASCATQNFNASWTTKGVTAEQINRWNRWTLWCPGYLDKDGEPNLWTSVPVFEHESREDQAAVVDTWLGCLRDFDDFVASPEEVLKRKEAPAAK
jgi:hypothetical protein